MAQKASDILSHTLGSQVNIENLTVNLFNSISAEGIVIYDQQKKKMLQVDQIDASFELLPLLSRQLNITNIKLFHPQALLYKDTPTSKANYQFLIDSLAPKDNKPKEFKISLQSILINGLSLAYDVKTIAHTNNNISPNHIHIEKLNTSIIIKDFAKASQSTRIRSLYLKAPNGLEISKLQAMLTTADNKYTFNINELQAKAHNIKTRLTKSFVKIDACKIGHSIIGAIDSLRLNCTFNTSHSQYVTTISSINNRNIFNRPLHTTLKIRNSRHTLFAGVISTSYDILKDIEADIETNATKEDISDILSLFGTSFPNTPLFSNLQNIEQKAHIEYTPGQFLLSGTTKSNLFDFSEQVELQDCNAKFSFDINSLAFSGKETSETFQGNDILLGQSTLNGFATLPDKNIGEFRYHDWEQLQKDIRLTANAKISQLTIGPQTLSNIEVAFDNSTNDITADTKVADSKANYVIRATFENMAMQLPYHKEATVKEQHTDMLEIGDFPLKSINAHKVSAYINNPHDFAIDINNISLLNTKGEHYSIDALSLACNTQGDQRNYTIKGDNLAASLQTNLEPNEIIKTIQSQISSHLPSLANKNDYTTPFGKGYAYLRMNVSDLSNLPSLLNVNAKIIQPVTIYGQLNTLQESSSLTVSSPEIQIDGTSYKNTSLYFNNKSDSIVGSLMATRNFKDIPVRIENHIVCKDNTASAELIWKALNSPGTQGSLKAIASFSRQFNNKLHIDTHITPTQVLISDSLWQIKPAHIVFDDRGISIDRLQLSHNDQYVDINATIKDDLNNILVKLNDIEIDYILSMTNFKPAEFSGKATGTITNNHTNNTLSAKLIVNNFCFNKGYMGTLFANATYDTGNKTIFIDAKTQASAEDSTIVKGSINTENKLIDFHIESEKTNLQFLNKYVGRFITDLEGNTSGKFRLFGDLKYVNMEANHRVNYLQFRPKMLGVLYHFIEDSVHIRPDTIDLSGMTVIDPYNNRAKIKGSINHHFLFGFNYNLNFLLNNLQVINWAENPSRQFWGTMFTAGNLNLHGTTNTVNIDGELTSTGEKDASTLYYNSETSSEEANEKNYIHFVTPEQKVTSTAQAPTTPYTIKDTSADIYMNFKFNTTPNATLNIITDPNTRDYMSLKGSGPLRISYYNKGKFELNGLYSISGGNYKLTIKDIIHKNFAIQPNGHLRFNGNPAEGDLNIKGVHRINSVSLSDLNVGASKSNSTIGVDCILNFIGKASDPKVSFDLDFPNANSDENQMLKNIILTEEDKNMQAVYLLSIGRFYTYNYNTFETNEQSQSAVAMTSFLAGTLSGQINNLLQDAFHTNNWNFGTNFAAGRQGFNDMEVQGNLSGKMFSNRLLFNGNFGYRNQLTTYSNNFVGDFNLQWLINKAGTISLKAYSETNDRYFTKSSLTTQGGGILFQKDFNHFRNFFRRKEPALNNKTQY